MRLPILSVLAVLASAQGCATQAGHAQPAPAPPSASASSGKEVAAPGQRRWLAGDHHVHSVFSADYADSTDPLVPPTPVMGNEGLYSIPTNAMKAHEHGLAWMVSTDHGGPHHSKLNYEQAWPALQRSRLQVPEVVQFYGMEFDTPAGDHSSLIVPHTHHERDALRDVESRYARKDAWPFDPARDTEERMLEALRYMGDMPAPPVLLANHPSRSATGVGVYGNYTPAEFRNWNDAAPHVAVGMEGAPGHQANALHPDGSNDPGGTRGGYRRSPTMGGFDQMTARLGGLWDSMLGEGRRWWVTSTSDLHRHWRVGGSDFWPGEYSKTYVLATHDHADILDGIRNGRVFVTLGDLISELDVVAQSVASPDRQAGIGGLLSLQGGGDVRVTIRVRDPAGVNHGGHAPQVSRVDLIVGEVHGPVSDRGTDTHGATRVVRRFTAADWQRDGEILTMSHTLPDISHASYLRVRGTSTDELEPQADPPGEDPWSDLWFYGNPIFIDVG